MLSRQSQAQEKSKRKSSSYRSPFRSSAQAESRVSQDTPFQPEGRNRVNSLVKTKQPEIVREQDDMQIFSRPISTQNLGSTIRTQNFESQIQSNLGLPPISSRHVKRESIATDMRQSRLPFQPAQTNDSDMVPTEEDEQYETLNDEDSLNERLISSKIDTHGAEQAFEENESFMAELKNQNSINPIQTMKELQIEELDINEQSLLSKVKDKKPRTHSRQNSGQMNSPSRRYTAKTSKHSRNLSGKMTHPSQVVAHHHASQQIETNQQSLTKMEAKEVHDISDLLNIISQAKNNEFEVNGVRYKIPLDSQAFSASPSVSLGQSGKNSRRSSNKSSVNSPKGPWMKHSSPQTRPKFQSVNKKLTGWSTSMRSMGARSPPTLKSQFQMLSINKSEVSKPNPRTNRQEYNRVRQRMEQLFYTQEQQPKIRIQDSINSNQTHDFEESKSFLLERLIARKKQSSNYKPHNEQGQSPMLREQNRPDRDTQTNNQTCLHSIPKTQTVQTQSSPGLPRNPQPHLTQTSSLNKASPLLPQGSTPIGAPSSQRQAKRKQKIKIQVKPSMEKYPSISPLEQANAKQQAANEENKDDADSSPENKKFGQETKTIDFKSLMEQLDNSAEQTETSNSAVSLKGKYGEHPTQSRANEKAIASKFINSVKPPLRSDKNKQPTPKNNYDSNRKTVTQATKSNSHFQLQDEFSIASALGVNQSEVQLQSPSNWQLKQMAKEIDRLKYIVAQLQEGNQTKKRNQLHVGHLYASPIIFEDQDPITKKKGYQSLPQPQLNFANEVKAIKQAMIDSGLALVFKSNVATKDNFIDMLNREPRVLHITCHGLQIEASNQMSSHEEHVAKQNCLLFETHTGEGELVCLQELQKLIRRTMPRLDVVFVAACDSELVGKIFLKCGARHVICVKTGQYVLDEASIQFTQQFYAKIFNGTEICDAFESAREIVEAKQKSAREARLFIKFTKEQEHTVFNPTNMQPEFEHICYGHHGPDQGQFKCITDHVGFKAIPAKLKNIKFRDKEMWELIKLVMSGNRLVILLGLDGVGKSSLARNALHYMSERKFFTGGVILVQIGNLKEIQSVLKKLQLSLFRALKLNQKELVELTHKTCSYESLITFIIDFFNSKVDYQMKKQKHNSQQSKRFLLCFDNAEELITSKNDEFKLLLGRLTDDCPQLSVVITSNRGIKKDHQLAALKTIFLEQMHHISAVNLFLDASSHDGFDVKELADLILKDKSYPIQKLMPTCQSVPNPLTQEFQSKLCQTLMVGQRYIEALSYHDLFTTMQGNPQAIVMLAAAFSNRFSNVRSLIKLYDQVLEDKKRGMQSYESGELGGQIASIIGENYMSLLASAEASIKLLEQGAPECLNLLYFLGCLPGGVHRLQLKQMWNDDKKQLDVLKKLSFLDMSEDPKVMVNTFITAHVKNTIDPQDKEEYMKMICEFYINLLADFFKSNGVLLAPTEQQTQDIYLQQSSPDEQVSMQKSIQSDQLEMKEQQSSSSLKTGLEFRSRLQGKLTLISQGSVEQTSVFQSVIEELMNIENCLEYFIQISEINPAAQRNKSLQKQNIIGSPTQKSDELEFDMELSPVNNIFRNPSNFEYDPNKSLRLNLAKQKEEPDYKDSPGPFQMNKIPSPNYSERHVSKSQSITNDPPSSFEEFQNPTPKKLNKTPSLLETIDEKAECDPRDKVLSFMSSAESDPGNRHSIPVSDRPSISISNLDKSDPLNERVDASEKAHYKEMVNQMKEPQEAQSKQQQIREGYNSTESQKAIPVVPQFQGTISLPFGERLITDHDSDAGFELSSEEQTIKTDSVKKFDVMQQPQDNAARPSNSAINSGWYRTEQNKDLQTRIQDIGSRLPKQESVVGVEYNDDMRNSQVFEMQMKANASVASMPRRKTTKHDLQTAMDSESKFSLPRLGCRRVSIHGSLQGTMSKLPKRSRQMTTVQYDQEEMNIPGRFILLMAANIFLSKDYEYSLSICSHNFSQVANTSLFEGNILRFKSLSAERLFQHVNQDFDPQDKSLSPPESHLYKQMPNLFLALESAQHALEIYRNRKINGKHCPNSYGMALQQYQIGWLYKNYASVFSSEQAQQLGNGHQVYNNSEQHKQWSIHYFNEAFANFTNVNHLRGMYLSKLHVEELSKALPHSRSVHPDTLKELKQNFDSYIKDHGTANCPHIQRDVGNDISLMVEIVDRNQQESLFKVEAQSDKQQSKRRQLNQQQTIAETENEAEESVLTGKQPDQKNHTIAESNLSQSLSRDSEEINLKSLK